VNDIRLYYEVLVQKICGKIIVCLDSANPGCGNIHLVDSFVFEKSFYLDLPAQVQFCPGGQQ
jgi:hypothetical protein